MDVETGRGLAVDDLEEGEPLLVAVALGDAGDQLALQIVERGKQGERPVADIVVGLGLDVANAQGQAGLGALARRATSSPIRCGRNMLKITDYVKSFERHY